MFLVFNFKRFIVCRVSHQKNKHISQNITEREREKERKKTENGKMITINIVCVYESRGNQSWNEEESMPREFSCVEERNYRWNHTGKKKNERKIQINQWKNVKNKKKIFYGCEFFMVLCRCVGLIGNFKDLRRNFFLCSLKIRKMKSFSSKKHWKLKWKLMGNLWIFWLVQIC